MSRPTAIWRPRTEFLAILILVVVGLVIFVPRVASVVLIEHDDVISVIAATCNQGRFDEATQVGRWVPASQWQQYWQMREFGCFGQISDGLTHHDIHPPLYFWLLHIWFSLFGVSILNGLLLSLLVLLVTAVIVYLTCRVLSVSARLSFIATLAWMLCLPSRSAISVIRQYTLFSMWTALLVLVMVLWLQRGGYKYLFAIIATLTAGVLTHYQFPIPAAFAVIFCIGVFWRRHLTGEIVKLLAAVAGAAALFFAIHPGAMTSVLQANDQAQSFELTGFLQRMGSAAAGTLQIFNPLDWSHPLPYGALDWSDPLAVVLNVLNIAVGAVGLLLVVRILKAAWKSQPHSLDRMLSTENLAIAVGAASWLTILAMYLFFVSPGHAINLQYLHFVTPLVFVGVAQAVQNQPDLLPRRVGAALPAVLLVSACIGTTAFALQRSEQLPIREIRAADYLLVDSARRGILPAILWHANPVTEIYAASQDELLTSFPDLAQVGREQLFYVSSTAYDNKRTTQQEILDRLATLGYPDPVPVQQGVVPLVPFGGDIYRFAP